MNDSPRIFVAVILAVAATLLAAGCSGSPAPSNTPVAAGAASGAPSSGDPSAGASAAANPGGNAGAASGDACTMITADDAAVALGAPTATGTLDGPTGSTRCTYADGSLLVYKLNDLGKSTYETERAAVPAPGQPADSWSELSGLGDGAFEVHYGAVSTIVFYKGTTMVTIILVGTDTPPTAAAVALAGVAATRL